MKGFFGMNFFTLTEDSGGSMKWAASRWIWVFFVLTLPITVAAILLWLVNGNYDPRYKWLCWLQRYLKSASKANVVPAP